MPDPHAAPQAPPPAPPPALLDDQLALVRHSLPAALAATAIRTRSTEARLLLARAALGDAGTLTELLAAARAADHGWLRRIRRGVRPALLAGLAQTLALQDLLPTDRRDALAVYDLIRAALGARRLPARHQGLHAQLAFVLEGPDRTRALLRAYPQIKPQVLADLRIDLLNPFSAAPGLPSEPWLAAFQTLLPAPGVTLDTDDTLPPFDRLTPAPTERVDGPQRISVIVTTYRPGPGLITAVRSILAQSWRNVEVIVVDDASPAEYDPMLSRCVSLGERIRLVKLPVNGGTYAARNAGLDVSAGEFVAFQDSDDFSHPHRLHRQVRALLDDPLLVAGTSDGVGVTEELLLTVPSVRSGRFNPSSLLLRRDTVMRRIGYFDQVRRAGDSEYISRIAAAFGDRAVHHLDEGPLALIRLAPGSQSRAETRSYWMHPARAAYCSAYLSWHEQIAAGAVPAYRPRDGADRPFAAPEYLRTSPGTAGYRGYDVVVVADWRFTDGVHAAAIDEIRALHDSGLRVAIVHLEAFRTVLLRRLPLAEPIQRLLNDGVVDQVQLSEPRDVALVVVRQPTVLQFAPHQPAELRPRRVLVVADRAPARGDDTDHRYVPDSCTRAARRLFGVDPLWCPQDGGVRAALRGRLAATDLTAYDLPHVVDAQGRVAARDGVAADTPVVGSDLCDGDALPGDLDAVLSVHRRLDAADVRIRLPDRPYDDGWPDRPASWLVYGADDLDTWTFVHQLDVYLHFPHPAEVETSSRPVLQAAAAGCVILAPPRFAATYGDAAVYCEPAQVADELSRHHRDRSLFAAQSRRAAAVAAVAHHPRLLVDRIAALVHGTRLTAPLQRAGATTGLPPAAGPGAAGERTSGVP